MAKVFLFVITVTAASARHIYNDRHLVQPVNSEVNVNADNDQLVQRRNIEYGSGVNNGPRKHEVSYHYYHIQDSSAVRNQENINADSYNYIGNENDFRLKTSLHQSEVRNLENVNGGSAFTNVKTKSDINDRKDPCRRVTTTQRVSVVLPTEYEGALKTNVNTVNERRNMSSTRVSNRTRGEAPTNRPAQNAPKESQLPKTEERKLGTPQENETWVWGMDDRQVSESTTTPVRTLPDEDDLDDRVALAGDKCPTGFAKISDAGRGRVTTDGLLSALARLRRPPPPLPHPAIPSRHSDGRNQAPKIHSSRPSPEHAPGAETSMTVARGEGSPERLGGALRRLHYRATRRAHSAAARHHSSTPKRPFVSSVDIMASKANVTFNVLLLSVAIIIANVIRSRVLPISNEIKKSLGYSKGPFQNFTQITGKYGYYSEEHTVVTEDGYILTIFRMNSKRCFKKMRRPPVILMHGLLLSSDAFLDAGPDAGMAFLLADACYDLWVGNQRGNYYARRHVRLNPDTDSGFWQFSVDESGFYDVSATIDYVLKYTNEKTLNYVGYSQGAGTFFVMCSERPGYCDKVDLLVGLAPAARQTYTRSKIYRISAISIKVFEDLLYTVGIHEFLARGGVSQEFLEFFCQLNSISTTVCGIGESLFDSFHPGSITNETLAKLFRHFPAGTSIHNMARYGQSMMTSRFQKFDYGKSKNLALYGQNHPPIYNLSAVTTPFLIMYGQNDHLVDTKDIDWLVTKVPNLLEAKLVDDPLWNHFDVAYSQHNRRLLFPKVNEYLLKYSRG